jgi:hypothetical protein
VTVTNASTIRRASTLRLAPIHPEAADWSTRVVAQGDSVSTATLAHVSRLCYAIDAAGIRDRFLRLNVFSGNGLNAAITPLFRGRSLTGPQFGGTVDTNVGGASGFVSGDFSESVGLSVGLSTSKYLDTGFSTSLVTASQWEGMHLSGWHGTTGAAETDPMLLGANNGAADRFSIQLSIRTTVASNDYARCGKAISVLSTGWTNGARPAAFLLAQRTATTLLEFYRNGSLNATNTTAATGIAAVTYPFYVFRVNNTGTAGSDQPGMAMRHYSIGLSMTAAQVAAFYSAMLAYNTSMGRTS